MESCLESCKSDLNISAKENITKHESSVGCVNKWESGLPGLQARFGQFCKGNYGETRKFCAVELMESGTGGLQGFGQFCRGNRKVNTKVL